MTVLAPPIECYNKDEIMRYEFYGFAAQQLSDKKLMDPYCPALSSLPMLCKWQKLDYM